MRSFHTNLVYTGFMKNVTITIPDDVHQSLRGEASRKQLSLNALVREILSEHAIPEADDVAAEHARLVVAIGTGPNSWKWNREELYEERLARVGKDQKEPEKAGG